MTLLTIGQDAADEIKIDRPTSLIGSEDPQAQTLLRYANKVGRRLMVAAPWQALRKQHTFTALGAEEQTGILPSDFDRFVPETFWDTTNRYLVSGPVSPVQWQGLSVRQYSGPARKMILRGNSVHVIPAFTGGEALVFEYISNSWCQSSGGSGQERWAADTDTGVIDEELITLGAIYEFLVNDGQPANMAARAYEDRFKVLIDNDQPGDGVMVAMDIFGGGRHFTGEPPASGSGLTWLF